MPWTVRVETERGVPEEPDFGVSFDEIPSGSAYPICNSVARYYDTIFNPEQLETFVKEWDAAAATPEFAYLREHRNIRDVAEKCARQQSYLRFFGD